MTYMRCRYCSTFFYEFFAHCVPMHKTWSFSADEFFTLRGKRTFLKSRMIGSFNVVRIVYLTTRPEQEPPISASTSCLEE